MAPNSTPLLLVSDIAADVNAKTSNAVTSSRLLDAIAGASAWLTRICHRRYDEYLRTRTYTARSVGRGGHVHGLDLWLSADLRAVTSITNGDGYVLQAGDYVLIGDNEEEETLAYQFVHLHEDGSVRWTYATRPVNAIAVAGSWGYGGEWVATGTTLAAPIANDTVTTATVADGTKLEAGMLVKLGADTEYAYVESIATNTVTLTRGRNGSTAASHLTGLTVYRWRAHELARRIVARMVLWKLEQNKSPLFGQVAIGDLSYPVSTDGIPTDVVNDLKNGRMIRARHPIGV